jgi:lipopolysaccharide export system protein LptC
MFNIQALFHFFLILLKNFNIVVPTYTSESTKKVQYEGEVNYKLIIENMSHFTYPSIISL